MIKTIKKFGKLLNISILGILFLLQPLFINQNTSNAAVNTFQTGDKVLINVKVLYVRISPSTKSTIISSQFYGDTGTVLEGPKSGNGYTWYKINYDNGKVGWSAGDFLKIAPPAVSGTKITSPNLTIGDNVITTQSVSVRSSASTRSSILGSQAQNSKGIIISGPKSGNGYTWYKVDYETGVDGWTMKQYLTLFTNNTTLPNPPSSVSASALSASQINLSWSAVAGATSYNVYSNTASDGVFTKVVNNYAPISYTDASLTCGITKYYYVTSINSIGESIASSQASAKTLNCVSIPQAPTSFSATTYNQTQINLSWASVAEATSYNVYRSLYNGGAWTKITSINGTSYNDTSLPCGTTQYYYITAVNSAGESTNSSQANATTIACTPTPTSTLLWGAYVGDGTNDLLNFETLVGKPVNLYADFEGWSNSFPSALSSKVGQKGKTLIIFWEPSFGYDSIINGSKDAYITQFASAAKTYNYPVILVPFDEMNLNEEAWGYGVNNNTAEKFKTAWIRIHNLFATATNVKFGIAYNNESWPDVSGNKFNDYYPGDAYVDYVGVDGFNFGDPWIGFGQIFDTAISTLNTFNKPIIIFSTASIAGSQKASWITEGLGNHIKTYSNVIGWVWFNQGGTPNWLVNSDTASLSAFKAVLP